MLVLYYFLIFYLGAMMGSFISALTYRWPRGLSLWKIPRSFTDCCRRDLPWWLNIPILFYLFSRGRCYYCHRWISRRYLFIELISGLMAVGVVSLPYAWPMLIGYFLVMSIAVAIVAVDWEHLLILDELVGGLWLLGLWLHPGDFWRDLGGGVFLGIFLLALHYLTRGRGMGLGDVKLVIPLGMLLGWQMLLPFLWLSFVLGACVGLGLMLLRRKGFKSQIAFGPFLSAAYSLMLFKGDTIMLYWSKFIRW